MSQKITEDITKIQACFVQNVVYLAAGRVGFDEHEEQRARYVHTNLSEPDQKLLRITTRSVIIILD